MKHSFLILLTGVLILSSCNNESKKEAPTDTVSSDTSKHEEIKVQIPDAACYSNTRGKDSIFLKTEIFPNVVTGTLSYKFYEKDSNKGEMDGKLNGDTLLADYKFMSEGKQSIRQVAFLISGNTATEGYGEMEEKGGKMVFKNIHTIDFKNGIKLQRVPCPPQ